MKNLVEVYIDDKSKRIIYFDNIMTKLISCSYVDDNKGWAFIAVPFIYYLLRYLSVLYLQLNLLNRIFLLTLISSVTLIVWDKIMNAYYKKMSLGKREIIMSKTELYAMGNNIKKHYIRNCISFIIIIILTIILLSIILLTKELFFFIPFIILILLAHYFVTCLSIFGRNKIIKNILNNTFESESIY